MSLVRRLLVAFSVLLLILGAGAAYVVWSFDSARVKHEIETRVSERMGRKIAIDDRISLSFFPDVALALGGVHLSERGQPEREFAVVEHVRVSVRLMPLLSQRVEAEQVELAGLKARIVVGKAGQRNIDDLLAGPAPAGAEPSAKTTTPAPRFSIAGIRIERAALSYVDEQARQSFDLSDFSLRTDVLANAATGNFKAAGKFAGAGMKLGFDAQGVYRYDLDAASFAADQLSLALRGDAAGIKGLEATLHTAAVSLKGPQELLIDKLSVTAKGQRGGEGFELALDVPKLALASGKASGETLKLDARLAGKDGPLALLLQASELRGSAESVDIGRVSLKIDGQRGDNRLNGQLLAAVKANLVAKTAAVSRIDGELTLAGPTLPMKSAKLALAGGLRIDWGRMLAAGETTIRFDDSTIQSKWDVARFSPLSATFDVAVDRLNIDRYVTPAAKPATAAATAAPAAKATTPPADSPIDLTALQGQDARGTIRIGALQAAKVKVANFRTDLRLQSGRLDLTGLAANLYEGRIAGSASIDSHGNRIAIKQTLESININPLLRDAIDKDVLEGRGNMNLDLNTGGATLPAMKRALAGSAAIALKDGAIKGINLAKSFRELKARVGTRQDAVQKASQADRTDFSEMTMSFRVAGGVAHSEDLSAKSPFLRLGGAGDINIGESTINYLAKASVVNTSGGQEGKDLEHVKGMTIPVRLTGPFDNVAYRIEVGSLLEEAVKAQAQEKLQQKVESKLGDKLKGLFKK